MIQLQFFIESEKEIPELGGLEEVVREGIGE